MSLRGLNVASGPGPAETVSRTVLVILRMYLGVIFLVAVWPKLTADPGWVTPKVLADLVRTDRLDGNRPVLGLEEAGLVGLAALEMKPDVVGRKGPPINRREILPRDPRRKGE